MTTRRVFLKSSGLAVVSFGALPHFLARTAQAGSPRRRKTLVVLFQRGACDGLNTVVPHGDTAYRSLRPTIAIPRPNGGREAALDLDGFFGLHPALEPLLPSWREGSLAVVHAVGSPDTTRSHFDAQDFMESGTPGRKATEDGWMNRCLKAEPDPAATPFRAVALTPTLPRSLTGTSPALALRSLSDFGLHATATGLPAVRGFDSLEAALGFMKSADPSRYAPAADARYPRGGLGDGLKQVAQLIKADMGLELAFTEVGGWDHHAGEGGVSGQLASRLRDLGQALAAFRADLGPRLSDVVLVTLTEFGRTARENGNRGTDHGHGSVAFVMGGNLAGGKVHGRWPGLGNDRLYEGRDLAVTTDFRDLLAEIVTRHLGIADLGRVFPGFPSSEARFPGVLRA
ncbi:MAG TPA: DUF1501 domain-containing protein [Vicinamibacteria bacterium]|nr:DUF1501 domain-containing protein [Vicinamibacteria bacterium]